MEKFKDIMDAVLNTKGVVTDRDNTLVPGNVDEEIGKAYMKQVLLHLKIQTYHSLMRGYSRGLEIHHQNKSAGKGNVLGLFYEILIKNGLGTKKEMIKFADKYVEHNQLEEVKAILTGAKHAGIESFLVTMGGSTSSEVTAERYGIEKFNIRSNHDKFDEHGRLQDADIWISNGEQKLAAATEMLGDKGLEEFTFIGDSKADEVLFSKAKVSIASSFATEEVNAITDFHLADTDLFQMLRK